MTSDLQTPLGDFARVPDEAGGAPRAPHPGDPSITSPDDAARALVAGSVSTEATDAVANPQAAADARCAWLSGGNSPTDEYVLNWSGSRDSKWDWIGLAFDVGDVPTVAARWYSEGWQWAVNGHSYTTDWTPTDVSNQGGSNARAQYFVWSADAGEYMAEPAC